MTFLCCVLSTEALNKYVKNNWKWRKACFIRINVIFGINSFDDFHSCHKLPLDPLETVTSWITAHFSIKKIQILESTKFIHMTNIHPSLHVCDVMIFSFKQCRIYISAYMILCCVFCVDSFMTFLHFCLYYAKHQNNIKIYAWKCFFKKFPFWNLCHEYGAHSENIQIIIEIISKTTKCLNV